MSIHTKERLKEKATIIRTFLKEISSGTAFESR